MNTRIKRSFLGTAIGAIVGLAIGIGAVAWFRIDPSGDRGSGLPDAFSYDLEKYEKIDPSLIQYTEKAKIEVGLHEVRAVAVGPDDHIYVASDKMIRVFDPDGNRQKEIALDKEPSCLAVAGSPLKMGTGSELAGTNTAENSSGEVPVPLIQRTANAEHNFPNRIYVGMRDHVEVINADGTPDSVWSSPSKRSVLTSIAVADEDVFVADAGSVVVWHYDLDGKLLGAIGRRDESRGIPQLVIPSPYFDVAIAPDGLLRVVNPGMHHIEAFTFDGHMELSWGKRGMEIDAFCGCCNPSNIAILPDGRVVTAEKGIPRVKVYSESGQFESVVVGPETLAPGRTATVETRDDLRLHPVDLAVDSRSRILVLDPAAGCVRIFEHK
jgi:hypothetical protein